MLLRLTDISKVYGVLPILENINFRINEKDRIGLIGANGAGKTTLLRIIAGYDEEYEPGGEINARFGLTMGYLAQEVAFDGESTLIEETLKTFSHLEKQHDLLRQLEQEMETLSGERLDQVMNRYSHVMELYERQGGYSYENETKETLFGLGFSENDLNLPIKALSGGQKSRAALAKLLLEDASLLLLDEPTNHLDIVATEWLERFLVNYHGALVVISHDRFFLDKVTTKTAEVEGRKLALYEGGYTRYLKLKQDQIEKELKSFELQQAEVKRQEEFIRRNIVGQKTKQAQDRRKRLEKLVRLDRPVTKRKSLALNFKPETRGGNEILSVKRLAKSYGSRTLFQDLAFNLRRLDRVGMIGPNGSGKSTLVKIIVEEERADRGKIKIGQHTTVGYYDQQLSGLDPTNRVIDEVWEVDHSLKIQEIRSFLGRFLFSGEDVFKYIKNLSGGEQSRVQLAKLILARMNFLIMDEPTNHLDLPSRQALEEFLGQYDGTLLIVTHDRYFLDRVVNRLLYFDGENVTEYHGNYSYFVRKREEQQAAAAEEASKQEEQTSQQKLDYLERKKVSRQRQNRERELKRRVSAIERRLNELEERQIEITDMLSDTETYNDGDKVRRLKREYDQALKTSAELYEEWEETDMKIAVLQDGKTGE